MIDINIQRFGGRGASSSISSKITSDITRIINTGQVFDFSVGPQMTLISRYEKGAYTYYQSSGDTPMRAFEKEIVPQLKDEFVVIDDGISKVPRTSRFKKYGYEVVGEITARDKDVYKGEYTTKERGTGDKWYLMRKKGK